MNKSICALRALVFPALVAVCGAALAQSWGPRSLEELKQETLRRAEHHLGPISGVSVEDTQKALAKIDRLDPDVWASAWMAVGNEYMARAARLESSDPARAKEEYYRAWRNFNVGRWPTEKNSPGKRQSYEHALDAFHHYGALLDPPIQTVHIPFENSELVAYLRLPKDVAKPPLVLGINGLDSRKEDVAAGSDDYIENGIAVFAIDMPGTGQSPVLIDVGSERVFSRAIDYLETRPDVDASRIVVQGRSWSGYWAAVLAYVERDRILGAAVHGCGVDRYYSREWQEKALHSKEYLFDLFPARSAVYGTKTMEEFLDYGPRLSLVARGLIDQHSAPMLLVNGERDTQQPISDLYLMMKHGDPKLAWVNPDGGHMGRSEEWPSSRIRREVVEPWVMRRLGVEPRQQSGPLTSAASD
jgi:esterase FrsA